MWLWMIWEAFLAVLLFVLRLWDRRVQYREKWIHPERLLIWCMPVGRWLSRKIRRTPKAFQKSRAEVIALYPMAPPEEVWKEYLGKKISQFYLTAFLCGLFLLAGLAGIEEEQEIGYILHRPEYGEGDARQDLIVREGEQETSLEIWIPVQEPDERQAEESLAEAEGILGRFIDGLGLIQAEMSLPVMIGNVKIRYETEGGARIDEEGHLKIPINEENEWRQEIRAVLSCGEYTRELSFEITIDTTEEKTFRQLMEEEMEGVQLTEEEVLLPSQRQEGTESLRWYLPGTTRESGKWVLIWSILPWSVFLFSREELRLQERKRQRQIQSQYPVILQKLSVFLGVGLSIQAAWERIVQTGDTKDPLIAEMRLTWIQMQNGTPLQEALHQFGHRARYSPLKRMTGMLSRNLRRGDEFLLERLQEMNQEAWEDYKKKVRVRSEEAQTKLLLPMFLTLGAILLMVAAPAMMSMQM